MIDNLKIFITKNIIKKYANFSPKKRKIFNKLFFFINHKLRSYYTIPNDKTNSSSIDLSYFNDLVKEHKLMKNHFIDKSVRDKIPSVSAYIPYLKNQTSIYFYNFFSTNYGLRKTLIGQLSLIDENDQIKKTSVITFPSRFNGSIHLNKLFEDLDGTSCILEVYHPRIFNNHGGNQGHLRFWGIYGDDTSTVHSMPLFPFIVKNDIPRLADRRYYPKIMNGKNYFINYNLKKKSIHENLEGDLSSSLKLLAGYTLQMKKNTQNIGYDYPSGVWHHSPFTRNSFVNKTGNIDSQIVAFPNVKGIDGLIFLGEYLVDNQEVDFTLFDPKSKEYITNKKINVNISKQLKVSDLFEEISLREKIVIMTPLKNNGENIFKHGYANIQYLVGNNICDGVHAHQFTSDRSAQGLKFMHYKIDRNTSSFFSIWGSTDKKINYRLRFFDSNQNFEKCFYLSINKDELVKQIDLKDFNLPDGHGIIQLECDSHNPAATSYIFKKIKNLSFISVCHMTGG